MKKTLVAAIAAALSFHAYAEENPLRFDAAACSIGPDGVLALQTLPMPKGWFITKGTFDRYKTDIRTAYSISTSSCDQGAGEATISSSKLGTFFTTLLNSQTKEIGYVWNMVGDLSANQNHWWYFIGCDGKAVKVGCDEPRTVAFAATPFGQDGQCRTYVNGLGITACAGDSLELQLASVQSADQHVDPTLCAPPEPSCGIGPCVSERVNDGGICDSTFPVVLQLDPKSKPDKPRYFDANEKARSDCKTGAACFCKSLLPPECDNDGNDCQ